MSEIDIKDLRSLTDEAYLQRVLAETKTNWNPDYPLHGMMDDVEYKRRYTTDPMFHAMAVIIRQLCEQVATAWDEGNDNAGARSPNPYRGDS